jgi:predicted DNA-binding transcriptional regulator AlpA
MFKGLHKLSIINCQFSILIIVTMMGCKEFPNPFDGDEVLARAGKETLHRMDVEKVFPAGVTGTDSVLWIESYVDRWVRDRLKLQEAGRLFGEYSAEDEELVQNYRNTLLTRRLEQHYINSIAADSLYTETELREYYDRHKSEFVLDRPIVKGRVIALPSTFRQKSRVKDLMRDYTREGSIDLKALADKNGFVLTVLDRWMEYPKFLELLPTRRNESYDDLLKKQGIQEMIDGTTTYWFVITEALMPGMTIPYEMIHREVRVAVSTRRKADVVKAREDSIYRAALLEGNAVINL